MLSRVADSLFWVSRYIERAENTARLADVVLQLELESHDALPSVRDQYWEAALSTIGDLDLYLQRHPAVEAESAAHFLSLDRENPSSILNCIACARENARVVRDQISAEMWETVNSCYLELTRWRRETFWPGGTHEFFGRVKDFSHLFQGLVDATCPRTHAHSFLQVGKFLERAEKTLCILDLKYYILLPGPKEVGGTLDSAQWLAVLRAASALEAFHRQSTAGQHPVAVADLLVLSRHFPRSLRFSLEQLEDALHAISQCPRPRFSNEAERICGRLIAEVNYTTREDLIALGPHEWIVSVRDRLDQIGLHFSRSYMFYAVVDPAAEAARLAPPSGAANA